MGGDKINGVIRMPPMFSLLDKIISCLPLKECEQSIKHRRVCCGVFPGTFPRNNTSSGNSNEGSDMHLIIGDMVACTIRNPFVREIILQVGNPIPLITRSVHMYVQCQGHTMPAAIMHSLDETLWK